MIQKYLFFCFLMVAASQDWKRKQVDLWVYIGFGGLALLGIVWKWSTEQIEPDWLGMVCGICLGAGILGLKIFWRDAIGAGDGCFFLVSSFMLGFWDNVELFLYGCLLCGLFCLVYLVWQQICGVAGAGKQTVPFLPFLIPAGIWIVSR